jgi:hypothetical protein
MWLGAPHGAQPTILEADLFTYLRLGLGLTLADQAMMSSGSLGGLCPIFPAIDAKLSLDDAICIWNGSATSGRYVVDNVA